MSSNDPPKNLYKEEAFETFISMILEGQAGHWIDIANAIGVDNNTITRWKKLPEAQEAIRTGINNALDSMEKAGAKDWRMWETKLKMLGLNTVSKIEVVNPIGEILGKYGLENGGDNVGQTPETKS